MAKSIPPRSESTGISEKRLAANRANAAKSTGPRTPEGKSRSSQNAVKHGFRASSFAVVRLEDLQEIADLKADAIAFYNPANAQELFAVERIALAQQMIFRAARLEAGLMTTAMNESLDRLGDPIQPMDESLVGHNDIQICKSQNRNYAIGTGFRRMARESNIWGLMLRYRVQADREYRRALEDFERLQALGKERSHQVPNEPNQLTQPELPEELAEPHELNFFVPRPPNSATSPAPGATPEPKPSPAVAKPSHAVSEPRPKAA